MGKKRDFIVEYAFFFIGMTVMSLGLVLMIQADLGVGPWDVLHLGVSYLTPLTIGIINILTGAVLVLLTIVINRKYVNLGCVINMVYIGLCIDAIFAIGWIPTAEHWIWRSLMMLFGIGIMGFGAGMYVSASRGAGPRDGLTLALSERLGWSIRKVRTIMEISVLAIGWLLGGPVFVGTLIFSLAIGPIMQFSLGLCKRWKERVLGRGDHIENLNQRAIRVNDHDGLSRQLR